MTKFRSLISAFVLVVLSFFVGVIPASAASGIKVNSCYSFAVSNGAQHGGHSHCSIVDNASPYHFHRVYIRCQSEAGTTGWLTGEYMTILYDSIKFCPSTTQSVIATSYQLTA